MTRRYIITAAVVASCVVAIPAILTAASDEPAHLTKPDYTDLEFPTTTASVSAEGAAPTTEAPQEPEPATSVVTEPPSYNETAPSVAPPTTTYVPPTTVYVPPASVVNPGPIGDGCCPYNGWAIPEYIVMCESGGSWDAYNPSGAAGPYQLMPFHFGDDARNHSQAEQHAMAAKIWAGGAGAQAWAACL